MQMTQWELTSLKHTHVCTCKHTRSLSVSREHSTRHVEHAEHVGEGALRSSHCGEPGDKKDEEQTEGLGQETQRSDVSHFNFYVEKIFMLNLQQ